MKYTLHLVFWVVILFAGHFITSVLFNSTCQGGTGNGIGMFEYKFRAYLYPRLDVVSSFDYIELQARAPERFMWNGNVSPSYDIVSMNWSSSDGSLDRQEGELQFDLSKNTMTFAGRELEISASNFFEFTKMAELPGNRLILEYLMRFLEDAKSGKLPKPSHHGHEIDAIAAGDLQHFASGYCMRYSTVVWPILWFFSLIVFYKLKRKIATVESD